MTDATGSTLVPFLRYGDAPAAIDWLCATFGFERRLVVPGEGGTIAHAELTFGPGMVMIGSLPASGAAGAGDRDVQGVHVVTPDPDAIHERARAAGATIIDPLADKDYGGRGFACRDPEGYPWSFGSYDPWRGA